MSPSSYDAETHDWPGSGTARDRDASETVTQIGRYQVEQKLGSGGFGAVYLAHDEKLKRRVAIKVPHRRLLSSADEIGLYLAEAQVLAKLDHPHIVPVYDAGRTDEGLCYIVSKFIEGTNLAACIKRSRPPLDEAVEIAACIAEALHHAHQRGVIHRDVKPGNILLDANRRPFLADFDLALKEEDYGKGPGYGGTPSYMSPEQARGEGHLLDGRSDIFSLGVVLYELLTGERPFGRGTMQEMAKRITTWDVRPPRQLCPSLPRELERICLRAVAKRASDRFLTSGEMAEDLRLCQTSRSPGGPGGPSGGGAPEDQVDDSRRYVHVVPKGLRAFDRQDADFYLSLLPGPRDREGLPENLRFWKGRIESRSAEDAFRVGVIYGPSGCGKSSLLRAGLMPVLDTRRVVCVYVESAAEDTPLRLLHRLQREFPELDGDRGLRETVSRLRRKQVDTGGRKVLIVLDQFEQCLATPNPDAHRQLVEALRQCDGDHVQCLVTVRDDFWLALSRFLAELEVDMLAGSNVALVDLFDLRHARHVLGAFGRAYGALPAEPFQWNADQEQFLEQAVEGLAEHGKVICVRLALFAEMMKAKSWEPSVLQDLGGAEGVGVAFLEETFDADAQEPRYRHHAEAARAVLESLLPPPTSDIKGHLCTREDLLQASGYARRPAAFEELLRILDVELRLVTPTDHEDLGRPGGGEAGPANGRDYYQLTHDYLVPSLREWLARKQRETKQGRAELQLAERAELWSVKPESRQLPSFLEWLQFSRLTRRKAWTEPQRQMMRTARRHHLSRAAVFGTLLLCFAAIGFALYGQMQAGYFVGRALEADTTEVPSIIEEMQPWRWWARPLLHRLDGETDSKRRLHRHLALLPHDPGQAEHLKKFLLTGDPDRVSVIRKALVSEGKLDLDDYWPVLEDQTAPASERLRAACALAEESRNDSRWATYGPSVAAWVTAENPLVVQRWGDLLRGVGEELVPSLQRIFADGERELGYAAALLLGDFLSGRPEELVVLNRECSTAQRRVLVDALREYGTPAVRLLQRELIRSDEPGASEEAQAQLAREKTAAATALMVLGEPDRVWPLLAQNEDPQLRTTLIHSMARSGVDPDVFVTRLSKENDSLRKIALMFILGEYHQPILTEAHLSRLREELPRIFVSDPHPGVHSACEWLLNKIGETERVAELARDLEMIAPSAERDWRINKFGHAFAVIRGPVTFQMGSPPGEVGRVKGRESQQRVTIEHSFAIGTREVTLRQVREVWPDYYGENPWVERLDQPIGVMDAHAMMSFCNWLSREEDIPEDQLCFEDLGEYKFRPYPDCLARTGYRLPTEAEWEYACRAGTTSPRFDGFGVDYLGQYAWYRGNSREQIHDVGQLKPNDLGLFDMYGNAAECCLDDFHEIYMNVHADVAEYDLDDPETTMKSLRGGSFGSEAYDLRSAKRTGRYEGHVGLGWGFRLVRTIWDETPENGR